MRSESDDFSNQYYSENEPQTIPTQGRVNTKCVCTSVCGEYVYKAEIRCIAITTFFTLRMFCDLSTSRNTTYYWSFRCLWSRVQQKEQADDSEVL